ncbi:MAG: fibronectin type III domain-containing protein [Acidobacteria bacterium]|nr:fibronectin type III domain-containing protein [Acidobacteriota bacterium]
MKKLTLGLAAPEKAVWALLACSASWAQPLITVQPVVDAITPTSARVTWVTNLASTTTIKFGLTTAYGGLTNGQTAATTDHSWYLSGLKPNTTYNFQVCSAVGTAETCSSNQVLTTAARLPGAPVPDVPVPPREVPTAPPPGAYGPPFYVNEQCSNLPTILTSLASLTGSLHYVVQVPAGTTCLGQFVFPQRRNHTGWVIVRTSSPDSAFAVENERIDESDTPALAKFVTDALPALWYRISTLPSACNAGTFAWVSDVPGFAVYECINRATSVPQPILYASPDKDRVVLSVPGHDFKTGDLVRVAGSRATRINGTFRITVLTPDSIRLDNSSFAGVLEGNWGGTVTRFDVWAPLPFKESAGPPTSTPPAPGPLPILFASPDKDRIVLQVSGHGYQTGDQVRVAGSRATRINGTWRITVLTPDTILLNNSSFAGILAGSWGGTVTNLSTPTGPITPPCSPNEWLYRTDLTPNTRAIFWCTSPGVWTPMRPINVGDIGQHAPIQLAAGASRYHFVGLELTHVPAPNPPPASWSNAPYAQHQYGALMLLQSTSTDIIIDRCNIHGLDYPSRLVYGIVMNGADIALLGSRVTRVNRWTEAVTPGTTGQESIALMIPLGPGPGRIENNFIEAIGITVFFPGNLSGVLPPVHYTIRKNHFSHPDKYLYGSPLNTSGKNYMNRQILELKTGKFFLIEGNIFDGNWVDVSQGAQILLTPRTSPAGSMTTVSAVSGNTVTFTGDVSYQPGMLLKFVNPNGQPFIAEVASAPTARSITLRNPPNGLVAGARGSTISSLAQISDINIRNNIFRNAPNVLWMSGHDTQDRLPTTLTTSRVSFTNNLIYGINALSPAEGGRNSPLSISLNGRSAIVAFAANGVEDLIVRNNTIGDIKGVGPTLLFNDSTLYGSNAGLDVRDNIFVAEVSGTGPISNSISGNPRGHIALDQQWTEFPTALWTFQNNVFCCAAPASTIAGAPPANIWMTSVSEIGFANTTVADYRLTPSSSVRAGAVCVTLPTVTCSSDGKAIGVDMDALNAATAKTLSGLR